MARMTSVQWRKLAAQWRRAAPRLDGIRREELARWEYDWRVVDALLDLGSKAPRKEESPNGLVTMQRGFMAIARKQGLWPAVGREAAEDCAPRTRRARLARRSPQAAGISLLPSCSPGRDCGDRRSEGRASNRGQGPAHEIPRGAVRNEVERR